MSFIRPLFQQFLEIHSASATHLEEIHSGGCFLEYAAPV